MCYIHFSSKIGFSSLVLGIADRLSVRKKEFKVDMINEFESVCCCLRRFRSRIAWADCTVDTSILHVIVINADASSLSLLHTLTSAMSIIFAC